MAIMIFETVGSAVACQAPAGDKLPRYRVSDPARCGPRATMPGQSHRGEDAMRVKFVALHALVIFGTLLGLAAGGAADEVIRIGCPTKTYFPTILATVAKDKGLFEKEGLRPEITIYRGGAETFEAIAAGSADLGTVAVPLVATSRKRSVLTKIVGANGD